MPLADAVQEMFKLVVKCVIFIFVYWYFLFRILFHFDIW